jgi:hypothetical protein
VPILAVRPASRRLSTKVRVFIEHLEKTFALFPALILLCYKRWAQQNGQQGSC